MIATILTALCREVEFFPPPRRFSRQFSRQSVASGEAGRQVIPTMCRDSQGMEQGILPVILPNWQDITTRTFCPERSVRHPDTL